MTDNSKPNPGLEQLIESCKGSYSNTQSHSCIREFKPTFPKIEFKKFEYFTPVAEPEFIKDEYIWNGKLWQG